MPTTDWQKSSYSSRGADNCLECRTDHGHVLIRDTQHRHLGQLEVPASEWRAFLAEVERL